MPNPRSSSPSMRTIARRAAIVPIASTVAGSATAALPAIALSPAWPPFGFLMLLGWRLLRPGLWAPWAGVPLGLADDLLTGQTLGTGVVTWTSSLILLDAVEGRLLWRDYWQEWLMATALIAFAVIGGWAIATVTGGATPLRLMLPQIAASALCFPVVGRLCFVFDRWRLAAGKIRPVG